MRDYRDYTPDPGAFDDRIVLVTGATRGIGRAVARDLVKHGATVLLHGRDAAPLETLYRELCEIGPEPAVAELDFEAVHVHELTLTMVCGTHGGTRQADRGVIVINVYHRRQQLEF